MKKMGTRTPRLLLGVLILPHLDNYLFCLNALYTRKSKAAATKYHNAPSAKKNSASGNPLEFKSPAAAVTSGNTSAITLNNTRTNTITKTYVSIVFSVTALLLTLIPVSS